MIDFEKKPMILYSIEYARDNYACISKTPQCKGWLSITLNDLHELPATEVVNELISEIQTIDHWFSERTPYSDPDAILEKTQKTFNFAREIGFINE